MKNTILLLPFLLIFFSANAQTDSLPDLESNFSALIVSDIDRSIEWYSKVFGFETVNKTELLAKGLRQANLKTETVKIELIELTSSISQEEIADRFPDKNKVDGFFKFGFTVSNFDDWVKHISKTIPDVSESVVLDNMTKQRMLVFKDPDGNRIQLFEQAEEAISTKVNTFLMFVGKAEEAMNYYSSLFDNAFIKSIQKYGANEPGIEGTVMVATFVLEGKEYLFSDSPPVHDFTFTPSISIFVDCKSEEEQERLFNGLSKNGKVMMPLNNYGFSQRFAWVEDQFGVSWQLNLP